MSTRTIADVFRGVNGTPPLGARVSVSLAGEPLAVGISIAEAASVELSLGNGIDSMTGAWSAPVIDTATSGQLVWVKETINGAPVRSRYYEIPAGDTALDLASLTPSEPVKPYTPRLTHASHRTDPTSPYYGHMSATGTQAGFLSAQDKQKLDDLYDGKISSLADYSQGGAGAVTRTVGNKLREGFVSVKDFGAVGDGVTDDTTAILAAATEASTSGRTLYFPSSSDHYVISNPISISPATRVVGESRLTSVIRNTNSSVYAFDIQPELDSGNIEAGGGFEAVTIRSKFGIRYNRAGDYETVWKRQPVLFNIKITDCRLLGTSYSQSGTSSVDALIKTDQYNTDDTTTNTALESYGVGVWGAKLFSAEVSMCMITGFGIGVLLEGCDISAIRKNRITSNGRAIHLIGKVAPDISESYGFQCHIASNDFAGNMRRGTVYIGSNSSFHTIFDNYFEQNDRSSEFIRIMDGAGHSIVANRFDNPMAYYYNDGGDPNGTPMITVLGSYGITVMLNRLHLTKNELSNIAPVSVYTTVGSYEPSHTRNFPYRYIWRDNSPLFPVPDTPIVEVGEIDPWVWNARNAKLLTNQIALSQPWVRSAVTGQWVIKSTQSNGTEWTGTQLFADLNFKDLRSRASKYLISVKARNLGGTPAYFQVLYAPQDRQSLTGLLVTSGSTTVTSAVPIFSMRDIGKTLRVMGAGGAGVNLVATITGYMSPTEVAVGTVATATVSAATGSIQSGEMVVKDGYFGFGYTRTMLGNTANGSPTVSGIVNTAAFTVGDVVKVSSGFPTTGPYKIASKTATTIDLADVNSGGTVNATSSVSGVTLSISDATESKMALVALPTHPTHPFTLKVRLLVREYNAGVYANTAEYEEVRLEPVIDSVSSAPFGFSAIPDGTNSDGQNWTQGDKVWNSDPASTEYIGWVCTKSGSYASGVGPYANAVTATDSHTITGLTGHTLRPGQFVTVSAGLPSTTTPYRIMAVSSSTITLDTAAASASSSAAVAISNPTFKGFGVIA